jgi:hypothetical protein
VIPVINATLRVVSPLVDGVGVGVGDDESAIVVGE